MSSSYPTALDSFATNKANATTMAGDHPAHHNDLADAVNKIEAELGTAPSGALDTVTARLAELDAHTADVAHDGGPHGFPALADGEGWIKVGGVLVPANLATQAELDALPRYDRVQDEGTNLAQRPTLNFAGAGVSAVDSGGTKTLVTIPGGAGSGGEFYDVKTDYGAAGDGVADDTAEIQAAIDAASAAGGGIVYFPAGTYLCLSLALKSNVKLLGPGAKLKKNGGGTSTTIITPTGTVGTAIATSANVAKGGTVISVASSTGIAAGDYVLLRDTTYKYSTVGRNLELNRVVSVTSTTITLANRTIGSYATASTAQICKLNAVSDATIEGLRLEIPVGTSGGGIHATYAYALRILDTTITGPKEIGGIRLTTCAHCEVRGGAVRDGQSVSSSGLGYGIFTYESTHHVQIDGVQLENLRESGVTDNSRYVTFQGCNVVGCYDSGLNSHGTGSEHCKFLDNFVTACQNTGIVAGFSGSQINDTDIEIRGNTISGIGGNGIITVGKDASTKSLRTAIVDNAISDWGLIGNGYAAIRTQNAKHVQICGNRIKSPAVGPGRQLGIEVLTGSEWITIAENRVSDLTVTGSDAIALSGATAPDRINILGNQVENVADQNLSIATAASIIIVGNQADDNTVTIPTGASMVRNHNIWGATVDA